MEKRNGPVDFVVELQDLLNVVQRRCEGLERTIHWRDIREILAALRCRHSPPVAALPIFARGKSRCALICLGQRDYLRSSVSTKTRALVF